MKEVVVVRDIPPIRVEPHFSKSRYVFSKTVEFCQRFGRGLHITAGCSAVTRHVLSSNERRKQRRKEHSECPDAAHFLSHPLICKRSGRGIITSAARSSTTTLVPAGVGGGFRVAGTAMHSSYEVGEDFDNSWP